jgi:hypothetical protein
VGDKGIPKAFCQDRRNGQTEEVPFGRAAYFIREGMDDENNFLKLLTARIIKLNTEMERKMQDSLSSKRP